MRVGLAQVDCVLGDKEKNLEKAIGYIEKDGDGVDILCFPELSLTGYNLEELGRGYFDLAETIPGPTASRLVKALQEGDTYVLVGLPEKGAREGLIYDSIAILGPEGVIGVHRKTHLFPPERSLFAPGGSLQVFNVDEAKIGVIICFEHAFSELSRILTLKGAQLIFNPSAVPKSYEYLWNLRLRARAQDNQLFVIGVNRVGRDDDTEFGGLSYVANPRGEIIAKCSPWKEEVKIVEINLNEMLEERKKEPVLRSRKPHMYHQLSTNCNKSY